MYYSAFVWYAGCMLNGEKGACSYPHEDSNSLLTSQDVANRAHGYNHHVPAHTTQAMAYWRYGYGISLLPNSEGEHKNVQSFGDSNNTVGMTRVVGLPFGSRVYPSDLLVRSVPFIFTTGYMCRHLLHCQICHHYESTLTSTRSSYTRSVVPVVYCLSMVCVRGSRSRCMRKDRLSGKFLTQKMVYT